jgi:hypothetical protein
MAKVTLVYVPLDWAAAGKAAGGGKPRKEDPVVFGPVAGTVVNVDELKASYAEVVASAPGFGKRGGKHGVADRGAASVRVGWWVKKVFPKVSQTT